MTSTMQQAAQTSIDDPALEPKEIESAQCHHVLAGHISPDQLAEELDVSPRTIARWESERIGPPRVLVGRRPYYSIRGVRHWIASQERRTLRTRRNS